jgi:prepilin-type N-terminal cleavage/methylation domain-containing protein
MSNHANHNSGFTLIELLVVIAIISLLSSTVLTSLSGVRASARDTRRKQDMRQIERALQAYFNDHNEFPCENPSSCDNNSSEANGKIGEGATIDSLLAPYMNGGVPYDPQGPGDSTYYYFYDGWHCNSEGDDAIVTISFNEAETADNIRRDTTCGPQGNVDDADYVINVGDSSG